jgi:GT2 family glycosyltransferase
MVAGAGQTTSPECSRNRGHAGHSFERVRPAGKFLFAAEERYTVHGVTYGTFDGPESLPSPGRAERDLTTMAQTGINTVRVYTVPPPWFLDAAADRGLRVLAGLPWEQHVTFLDNRRRRTGIVDRVRSAVAATAGHPAIFGYAVGNEIPPGVVRWHGAQRVEGFIEQLYGVTKDEDPSSLVTYANFPSTEYLDLPFLDMLSFNVFLEERDQLNQYVAQLHTIAGDRPLLISELGLDSHRHGLATQAESVAFQVATVLAAGCAGCFVFAWTDDWARGGTPVPDWDFGLVDRERTPKPALEVVAETYAGGAFTEQEDWPRVSVVVASYNGARTIGDCVRALQALDYPDYEVVVVDDGSTDDTRAIAADHGARVIRTTNEGLSRARNTGIRDSDGEIIAFCDDDCAPDAMWLRYLVTTLTGSTHVGAGGPNVPPPDGVVADAVGRAPGGPAHVLASPTVAEHIPGCNMGFWRSALDAVGGFDPSFRVAGDDVDICWRLQAAGGTLGFSPGAVMWHRARTSMRAYTRQQIGYGRSEALLERKWPERYNPRGHVDWTAKVHGGKPRRSFRRHRWQIYYGLTASALFQSVYSKRGTARGALPLAPEWYFLLISLALVSGYGIVTGPLFGIPVIGVPLAVLALAVCASMMGTQAGRWAVAEMLPRSMPRSRRLRVRAIVFALCLVQPLARLFGRTRQGLTPWRSRGPHALGLPRARVVSAWSEQWFSSEEWIGRLVQGLDDAGTQVARGTEFDTWDIQVRVGPLAASRVRVVVEEHGEGRQMARLRVWARWSPSTIALDLALAVLGVMAAVRGEYVTTGLLGLAVAWLTVRMLLQAAGAVLGPVRAAASLRHLVADEERSAGVADQAIHASRRGFAQRRWTEDQV